MRCVLGDIDMVYSHGFRPEQELLPRQYFKCSFDPSKKCLDVMESVADGIEGIAALMPNELVCDELTRRIETSFVVVYDLHVDPDTTSKEFFSKLRKMLSSIKPSERTELLGGILPFDPTPAMATNSAPTGNIDG